MWDLSTPQLMYLFIWLFNCILYWTLCNKQVSVRTCFPEFSKEKLVGTSICGQLIRNTGDRLGLAVGVSGAVL